MTEAVLFDNDDVLVDTEMVFFETTRAAFGRIGLDLTKETWGARYLADGKSSREIALSMGADADQLPALLEERNRQYRLRLKQSPPLRPTVRATLEKLHGRVRLAIVTGCGREQLDQVHGSSNLLEFFDFIVTSDDCGSHKPHPEPYQLALRALGVRAERCIAIEDSPRGLASARAAGVPCVVVPTELTRSLQFPGALAVEPVLSGALKHIQLGALPGEP